MLHSPRELKKVSSAVNQPTMRQAIKCYFRPPAGWWREEGTAVRRGGGLQLAAEDDFHRIGGGGGEGKGTESGVISCQVCAAWGEDP